ncbi:recombination protein NinB [Allohahella sp. A8]|uniref:recombination protein NinB n=1 Tax=Allohahella sp. A8 TaxID=3141461 RepID=UPI003A7FB3DB
MREHSVVIRDYRQQIAHIQELILRGLQAGPVRLKFGRPTRSTDQNNLMWALLSDFARSVEHCGQKYSPEDWKNLLTATFEGETRYAPALDGRGIIALGAQTSKYSKRKMTEFIEFVYATGADMGAVWSQQTGRMWNEHGEEVRAA